MLIFEAKAIIDSRLKFNEEYKDQIPEYFEALKMASKALEAQCRVADMINDLNSDKADSTYSHDLVMDILAECTMEGKVDEDENK